jgi:hypothetical protein
MVNVGASQFRVICENGTRTNYLHRLERKRIGNIGLHRDCRTHLLSCDLILTLGTAAGLTRTLQGAANFGFGEPGSQARCIILLVRHDGAAVNPGYHPVNESGRFSMLGRILAATLVIGGVTTTSGAARAEDPVAAGVAAGIITGAAIATGVVPYEHREPLREYIVRENRPSYRYEQEVVVGRELPPGAYESYPVPERYGVSEHHYAIVNGRPVIFHPQTRRIIHVYD